MLIILDDLEVDSNTDDERDTELNEEHEDPIHLPRVSFPVFFTLIQLTVLVPLEY